ncbi:Bax inhibitor-1/YccA family protein [Weissella tructae]
MDNYENPRVVNQDSAGLNAFFRKVYTYMGLALLVTFVTAYIGVTVFPRQIATIFSSPASSLVMLAIMVGFVFLFSRKVMTNPGAAFGMLMGFAVLNGATFAVIGMTVEMPTIIFAFLTTVFLFAGMAAYGFLTKKSMASWGSILLGAVIALIIANIINLFFFNQTMYLLVSVIGVVVFALYTAYDMNMLKKMYYEYGNVDARTTQGLAVSGALSLYMDFINLFIYLIRLFSSRD